MTVAEVAQDGVRIRVRCKRCQQRNVALLEWDEVALVSTEMVPPGWRNQGEQISPPLECAIPGCSTPIEIQVTPLECADLVIDGLERGYVPPEWARKIIRER